MAKKLDELIRDKAKELQQGADIDWAARRDAWLAKVNALYITIEEWLHTLISEGSLSTTDRDVPTTEQFIGLYKSIQKHLYIRGMRIASLTPRGTLVLRGLGRLDLEGLRGTVKIILADDDTPAQRSMPSQTRVAEGRWFLTYPRAPNDYVPLTKDEFERALISVSDLGQ
jgi:hypothetical protein